MKLFHILNYVKSYLGIGAIRNFDIKKSLHTLHYDEIMHNG